MKIVRRILLALTIALVMVAAMAVPAVAKQPPPQPGDPNSADQAQINWCVNHSNHTEEWCARHT